MGMKEKEKIKQIVEKLDPRFLYVKKIKISSFKKLGVGEGNLNYLLKIKNKKFICRINIDKNVPNKSLEEFNSLKKIERLKIAPRVFYVHPKDNLFPYGFIILEFIEGTPLRIKKRNYTNKQIKQLASILAELHLKKSYKMPKNDYSFKDYLKKIKEYNKNINRYNNILEEEFEEFYKKIKEFLSLKEEKHTFSLIHGDVCPQNIVESKGGLKLIDWESLNFSDPAKDIANILIDVRLEKKDLNLFIQEYKKIRKDDTIMVRGEIYAILFRCVYFLWEIVRSFEIINKELPKEYLSKTTAKSHIYEAKFQLKYLRKLIKIPYIDIDKLFDQNDILNLRPKR